jgi:hypothetical protein
MQRKHLKLSTEAVLSLIRSRPGGVTSHELSVAFGCTLQELGEILEAIKDSGSAISLGGHWATPNQVSTWEDMFLNALSVWQSSAPDIVGFPIPDVGQKAGIPLLGKSATRLAQRLEADRRILMVMEGVRLPTLSLRLTEKQKQLVRRIVELLPTAPGEMADASDLCRTLGVPLQTVLEGFRLGDLAEELVTLTPFLAMSNGSYKQVPSALKAAFGFEDFSASQCRVALGVKRKAIVPLLNRMRLDGTLVGTEAGHHLNKELTQC